MAPALGVTGSETPPQWHDASVFPMSKYPSKIKIQKQLVIKPRGVEMEPVGNCEARSGVEGRGNYQALVTVSCR